MLSIHSLCYFHIVIFLYMIIQGPSYEETTFTFESTNMMLIHILFSAMLHVVRSKIALVNSFIRLFIMIFSRKILSPRISSPHIFALLSFASSTVRLFQKERDITRACVSLQEIHRYSSFGQAARRGQTVYRMTRNGPLNSHWEP